MNLLLKTFHLLDGANLQDVVDRMFQQNYLPSFSKQGELENLGNDYLVLTKTGDCVTHFIQMEVLAKIKSEIKFQEHYIGSCCNL